MTNIGCNPEVIRECHCKNVRHEHGTCQAYTADLCRCAACRAAVAARQCANERARAYKGWRPRRDPTGATRRLQALMWCGWSKTQLAKISGMGPDALLDVAYGRRKYITDLTDDVITDVYQRLSDAAPPQDTKHQRQAATLTQRLARANHWHPPIAWDDDTISDPAARPLHPFCATKCPLSTYFVDTVKIRRVLGGEYVPLTKEERRAAVQAGTTAGLSTEEISDRIKLSPRRVTSTRAEVAA